MRSSSEPVQKCLPACLCDVLFHIWWPGSRIIYCIYL